MSEQKRSWFSTGYEGVDRERERLDRLQGPSRFWMKEQQNKELVFLDDEPFVTKEHNPIIANSYDNHFTCLCDVTDNVVCCEKLGPRSSYLVGFYTVVDTTVPTDAKYKKYQNEVKLLPATMKGLTLIKRKKATHTSLIHAMFTVFRDTKKDPRIGSEYTFARVVDEAGLLQHATYKGKKLVEMYEAANKDETQMRRLKDTFQIEVDEAGKVVPKLFPFNYMKLLEPRDPKDIRILLSGVKAPGREDDSGRSDSSDGIPF